MNLKTAVVDGKLEANSVWIGGSVILIRTTLASRSVDAILEAAANQVKGTREQVINQHITRQLTPDISFRDGHIGHALVVRDLRICFPPVKLPLAAGSPETLENLRHCTIDLRGLHVGELADQGGLGWGEEVRFWLDGFRYARLPEMSPDSGKLSKEEQGRLRWNRFWNPSGLPKIADAVPERSPGIDSARLEKRGERLRLLAQWERRLMWLNLQYFKPIRPDRREYSPDAYVKLVSVLNAMGSFKDARHISSARQTLENRLKTGWLRPLRQFCWSLFRIGFDYGFSVPRTFVTFVLCVGLGTLGALIVDHPWHKGESFLVMRPSSPEARYSYEKSRIS
jgi:hypothetical protein